MVLLLGCSNPQVLRPTQNGHWQLVGECFLYGVNDAIALLGPLPEPWKVQALGQPDGRSIHYFYNHGTGARTQEDPRLDPMNSWERIDHELEADDPETFDYFGHTITDEVVCFDPRLSANALRSSGVRLKSFTLL